MKKVTDAFLDLAMETTYESIPENVLHEVKRTLLDGIGDALGGISSDKGKIGVSFAHRAGGTPESTLIGVGGKVSASVAAFANAELLNGLDMDPIPHVPPILVPALFAVAEAEKVSGKELLRCMAVGYDVAARLSRTLLSIMGRAYAKYGHTPDVFGNSNEHIIGAGLGCGMLMGLSREKLANAIGISAYYCSVPVCRDWELADPKTMIKYVPVSWMAQGGVQAAMMAREGYTGTAYTLDAPLGFPILYCREPDVWDPAKVIENIGEDWLILNSQYKKYPCCRYIHSSLDVFLKLQKQYDINAGDIKQIRCHTGAFSAHPDQYSVENQIDAQFSIPYNLTLAAFGYAPGPAWQDKKCMFDPKVREFMQKVVHIRSAKYDELKAADKKTFYGMVEVELNDGTIYCDETPYASGSNVDGYRLTDEEMFERFRICASALLPTEKIEKAIDIIMNIEKYDSLDELVATITL